MPKLTLALTMLRERVQGGYTPGQAQSPFVSALDV
jgi:hypothetical protein